VWCKRATALVVALLSLAGALGAQMAGTSILSAAPAIEVFSNRHTQPDSEGGALDSLLGLNGYVKMSENDHLELWFREELHAIRIRVKATGYIWGGVAQDRPFDLNPRWTAMAHSILTVTYSDGAPSDRSISLNDDGVFKEYAWYSDGFICDVYLFDQDIGFTFEVWLSGNSVSFSIPGQPHELNPEYKLMSVYFVPFLGTVVEDAIPGYLFVPDGPGALMRFSPAAQYVAQFEKKIYGQDLGIDTQREQNDLRSTRPNDYIVEEPQIHMPVFGMAHGVNRHAWFAVVDGFEEYAVIEAFVAEPRMVYNRVAARFDYRQRFMQPINRQGTGISTAQEDMNRMSPRITYYFLSGGDANYSGIARLYRSLLLENGVLKDNIPDSGDIPLRIDILGADVRPGVFRPATRVFTTAEQAGNIAAALSGIGIDNLTMIYRGWERGGLNGRKAGRAVLERGVGSVKELESLRDSVTGNGGRFYLEANPVLWNDRQLSLMRHASTTMSRSYAAVLRDVNAAASSQITFARLYAARPYTAQGNLTRTISAFPQFDISVDQLGFQLYADYTRNRTVTRAETKNLFAGIGAEALNKPNAYMWGGAGVFLDTPVVNSQYLFQTDTVPFLQLVLRGSMELYAPYSNIGFFGVNSMLKMIEYGVYPSYILMAAENILLKDTPQEDLFTVYYRNWISEIQAMYGAVGAALSPVRGRAMVSHTALAHGVAVTEYQGGTRVFVNYGAEDYHCPVYGITVPAQYFAVQRGM